MTSEATQDTTGAIGLSKVLTPEAVFTAGGVNAILARIEQEVAGAKRDISTKVGRDEIRALAYKVARSKTALDEMGKTLAADWKAKAAAVDAERRTIRERLDTLRDEVRRPLTEWEDAERRRVDDHEAHLGSIEEMIRLGTLPSHAEAVAKIAALNQFAPGRDWQEFKDRAAEARARVGAALEALAAAALKREQERAELERLRQERAEQDRRERDERIAAAAAERARGEAEAAAAAREAARLENERAQAQARAERAEAGREAAVARAEQDRRAAELAAQQAAERAERAQAEAVATERRRAEEAVRAEAAAAAKREQNKRHHAKVNGEAREALVAAGLTRDQATIAITAIVRGEVPHTKISY